MTCACTGDLDREWPRGTAEYLGYDITVDVELTTQPVKITIDPDRQVFLDAEWIGTGTWNTENTEFTRACQTVQPVTDNDLPDTFAVEVFIQIEDTTEIPLIPAGTLTFV